MLNSRREISLNYIETDIQPIVGLRTMKVILE